MKWTLESAVECIKRNGGMVADKGIFYQNPGIKILGAIDFLVKYCGYNRKTEV